MLHPSYTEILEKINDNEDNPSVESRYSIVIATSKRAREIIAGDAPFVPSKENDKPLSIAVKELDENKIVILPEEELEDLEELIYEEPEMDAEEETEEEPVSYEGEE